MMERRPLYTVGSVNWYKFMKTSMEIHQKLKKNRTIMSSRNLVSGYISKENEMVSQRDIRTSTFTAVLSTIAKMWKQPKCQSMNECIKKMWYIYAAAKLLQSCPTLCDPIDGSPPGSPISGILQARTLEWVAISFFNAWKWKVKVKSFSHVRLFTTPWTKAYQAPPSMGFSRQEYWSGVPLPSPIHI